MNSQRTWIEAVGASGIFAATIRYLRRMKIGLAVRVVDEKCERQLVAVRQEIEALKEAHRHEIDALKESHRTEMAELTRRVVAAEAVLARYERKNPSNG